MATLYEYYNTDDDDYHNVYGANWKAQTFTVSDQGHAVTKVGIKAFRVGSPGTLTLSVRATDANGHPTGSDLTSGTTNANNFTTDTAGAWYYISVTSYDLLANTKYAVVVRCTDGAWGNHANWRSDTSSPTYASGNYEASGDSGVTWTANTGSDFMFEVYGYTAYTQTVSEVLGMVDTIPTKAAFKRTAADLLGMVDSVGKVKGMYQTVADSLGMVDAVGTKAAFKQAVSEVLGMVDSASRSRGFPITISEVLGLKDKIESKKRLSKIGDLPDHTITGGAP